MFDDLITNNYHTKCKACKRLEKQGVLLERIGPSGTSGAGDVCYYCGASCMTSGTSGTSGIKNDEV